MITFNVKVDVDTMKIIKERGFDNAQAAFTRMVKDKADDYVPFLDGDLRATVAVSKKQLTYSATHRGYTYAAKQYYENAGRGKQGTSNGGNRGKDWINRMWADRGPEIVQAVAAMIGGRAG